MSEREPQQIHYVQLEPGQALVVSAVRLDYEKRNPDLLEELRIVARTTADSLVVAMGGDSTLRYDFEVDHGETMDRLGERLHKADIPVDVVFKEAQNVYRASRMGVAHKLVNDLAGVFVDRLSYSPKEAA